METVAQNTENSENSENTENTETGGDPAATDELGTRQRAGRSAGGSVLSSLRWAWYSLTSMRTALILLFLLALGAVPGSILPQRGGTDSVKVPQYFAAHPHLAPILDHLGMFNVFGSAWFAAIYLLLFISLAGCVVPRSRRHLAALRARPPAAPRNLSRLPQSARFTTDADVASSLDTMAGLLRAKRYRVDLTESTVNTEKGHWRETGNLLFHLSLLVVLAGIAVTSLFGFSGSVIVKAHDSFTDTTIEYDSLSHGRLVSLAKLPPFAFTLDSFDATYVRSGSARGDANSFDAHVTWQSSPTAPRHKADVTVNHPLATDGTNVYLGGHGYAPHFVVHDGAGHTFDEITPFLPEGGTYESQGVVKLPDAEPQQLAIQGFFLPTAGNDPTTGRPVSIFPAPDNPAVVVGFFAGDLGLDNGISQSVYALDTSKLKLLTSLVMTPGQTVTLPDGLGTVTFAGYEQWADFNITHDPGKPIVFGAVCAMVAGLVVSLAIKRRRIWVRAVAAPGGRTVVEVGGLARTDASGGFDDEFAGLAQQLRAAVGGEPDPPDGPDVAAQRPQPAELQQEG
jgi:cytochrome c biogenesis protein